MIFAAPTEEALFEFYAAVSNTVCNKLDSFSVEERYAVIVRVLQKFEAMAQDISDGLLPEPKPKESN